MSGSGPNYVPQQAQGRNAAFYKAIQNCKRSLVQTLKDIKCNHFDDATKNLRSTAETLDPFANQKTAYPACGGQPQGPQFSQMMPQVVLAIENA